MLNTAHVLDCAAVPNETGTSSSSLILPQSGKHAKYQTKTQSLKHQPRPPPQKKISQLI